MCIVYAQIAWRGVVTGGIDKSTHFTASRTLYYTILYYTIIYYTIRLTRYTKSCLCLANSRRAGYFEHPHYDSLYDSHLATYNLHRTVYVYTTHGFRRCIATINICLTSGSFYDDLFYLSANKTIVVVFICIVRRTLYDVHYAVILYTRTV